MPQPPGRLNKPPAWVALPAPLVEAAAFRVCRSGRTVCRRMRSSSSWRLDFVFASIRRGRIAPHAQPSQKAIHRQARHERLPSVYTRTRHSRETRRRLRAPRRDRTRRHLRAESLWYMSRLLAELGRWRPCSPRHSRSAVRIDPEGRAGLSVSSCSPPTRVRVDRPSIRKRCWKVGSGGGHLELPRRKVKVSIPCPCHR